MVEGEVKNVKRLNGATPIKRGRRVLNACHVIANGGIHKRRTSDVAVSGTLVVGVNEQDIIQAILPMFSEIAYSFDCEYKLGL